MASSDWPAIPLERDSTWPQHLDDLQDDFIAIHNCMETSGSQSFPKHLFDSLYISYSGLSEKLKEASNAYMKRSERRKDAKHKSDKKDKKGAIVDMSTKYKAGSQGHSRSGEDNGRKIATQNLDTSQVRCEIQANKAQHMEVRKTTGSEFRIPITKNPSDGRKTEAFFAATTEKSDVADIRAQPDSHFSFIIVPITNPHIVKYFQGLSSDDLLGKCNAAVQHAGIASNPLITKVSLLENGNIQIFAQTEKALDILSDNERWKRVLLRGIKTKPKLQKKGEAKETESASVPTKSLQVEKDPLIAKKTPKARDESKVEREISRKARKERRRLREECGKMQHVQESAITKEPSESEHRAANLESTPSQDDMAAIIRQLDQLKAIVLARSTTSGKPSHQAVGKKRKASDSVDHVDDSCQPSNTKRVE